MASLIALGLALALQAPDTAVSRLTMAAQVAAAQFQDRTNAIRAGYRHIGPDSPEMGQHWINPAIFVDGRLDYTHPSVLTYTTINGKTTLTGVAYALPLAAGEDAPVLPGGLIWHQHAGSIDSELMRGVQHDMPLSVSRLAMLHVWTQVANPAGRFVEENWALPFARLGRATPRKFDQQAARALSLLTVGETYYTTQLVKAMGPERASTVSNLVDRTRKRAASAFAASSGVELSAETLDELSRAWNEFASAVLDMVTGDARRGVAGLLGVGAHH